MTEEARVTFQKATDEARTWIANNFKEFKKEQPDEGASNYLSHLTDFILTHVAYSVARVNLAEVSLHHAVSSIYERLNAISTHLVKQEKKAEADADQPQSGIDPGNYSLKGPEFDSSHSPNE